MVYPIHTLVAFGGTQIGGGSYEEIWQTTIRGAKFDGSTEIEDPDGWLANVHAPLLSWWTNATNNLANSFRLGWVKCNNINNDGTYIDPTTHAYYYTGSNPGGGNTVLPPNIAVACSWTTAAARGLAHRGRVYLPFGFPSGSAWATIDGGHITTCVATAKALLTLLKAAVNPGGTPFNPCVVSRGHRTGWDTSNPGKPKPIYAGTGLARPITGVAVGNRFDTQRRRINRVVESYTSSAWP